MKYNRIIALALGACLMSGISAEAQVSVRRGAKNKETEQQARPKDPKNREPRSQRADSAKPKNASSTPVMSDSAPQTAPSRSKEEPASAKPKPKNGTAGAAPVSPTPTRKNPSSAANRQRTGAVAPGEKTLRQQSFDEYQKDASADAPWQHVVYRELDLTDDANASLYFPVEPMDGLTNLFRVIISAYSKRELKAYEYLDGREIFTEKYELKPQDMFDKHEIPYRVNPASNKGGVDTYEVDDIDLPCNEVLSYYIKERWEFDQKHSKYQSRILCICPVLHRASDYGGESAKYPLFWVNYEDLRPFLRDHLIVSQGMNTAARYTIEEFFSLGHYKGVIYKEQNLRGLSLMQQYTNADTLALEQKRLDENLRAFKDSIWVDDSQTDAAKEQKSAKSGKREAKEGAAESVSSGKNDVTAAASGKSASGSGKKNRRTKQDVDVEAAEAEREARATTHKSVRRSR